MKKEYLVIADDTMRKNRVDTKYYSIENNEPFVHYVGKEKIKLTNYTVDEVRNHRILKSITEEELGFYV